MKAPNPRLGKVLHAQPGHVYTDQSGAHWRWHGAGWRPLEPGDTILDPNLTDWYLWTGTDAEPALLDTGAIVRVSWHSDGLNWDDQLCVVSDYEPHPEDPLEGLLLLAPWPINDEQLVAVVPVLAVELVAPSAPEDGHTP